MDLDRVAMGAGMETTKSGIISRNTVTWDGRVVRPPHSSKTGEMIIAASISALADYDGLPD